MYAYLHVRFEVNGGYPDILQSPQLGRKVSCQGLPVSLQSFAVHRLTDSSVFADTRYVTVPDNPLVAHFRPAEASIPCTLEARLTGLLDLGKQRHLLPMSVHRC